MPDEVTGGIRAFSLKVRCENCKREGEIASEGWAVRITGAIEILCSGCGKKTVYVGRFGHSVDAERLRDDLRRSGMPIEEKGGLGEKRKQGSA